MKGLELIKRAMTLQPVERVPWVPFVGVHGAFLIGTDATSYLNSADLMTKGISRAIELYQPDGIPVIFDLQLEAEILGCHLRWAETSPPAVVSHPLAEGLSLRDLSLPEPTSGRIPVVTEATRTIRQRYPEIALYGLVTGPFTLALHLLGTEIFLKLLESPEEVKEILDFCTEVSVRMSDFLMEAGCDVIAVVDPMTSQIDTETFREFVTPQASRVFDSIRDKGRLGSFFVCGHAQQNVEEMCRCRPDNISIDENIPLDFVREVALREGISFGGNLRLTVVLLMGDEEDARHEALNCLDMAGETGFILAPGCDIPMETPPENLKAVTQMVNDPYTREITRISAASPERMDILNMKDYGQADKVIVDIITLDSESCAPCQYMVEAVQRVAPHFEGVVEWREHAIKKMEAVTFMSSLMVKNIPTICIDGKIAFVSRIPPKNQLIQAIQERINEKLKLKIKSKKGEILIMGDSAEACSHLLQKVERSITELGKDVTTQVITDPGQLAAFGITRSPAVVTVQYKLKSEGAEPTPEVLREWLKEL